MSNIYMKHSILKIVSTTAQWLRRKELHDSSPGFKHDISENCWPCTTTKRDCLQDRTFFTIEPNVQQQQEWKKHEVHTRACANTVCGWKIRGKDGRTARDFW